MALLQPMELDRHEGTYAARSAPVSGRASVIDVAGRSLRLCEESSGTSLDADNAASGYGDPRVGDLVVYFTDASDRRYVIGVLRASRPTIEELLEESERAETERVNVRDKHGRLLFEYDPETDRAVLHVPDGDLAIQAPAGALRLCARDGVHVESEGRVRVSSGREVELEVSRSGAAARVALQPGEVSVAGSVVTIAARQAHVIASFIGLRAQRLETHVERARQVAQVIETHAERIVERARDTYREVERLSQHRAGRLQWVAETTASLVSETVLLKARDRMKIKGERIHLA
jgi:hypothetical protein